MGKTQLAVRFAQDHKHDFTAVFWLNGKDLGSLLRSLSSVFPQLPGQSLDDQAINDDDAEQRARHVLRWLSIEENSHWLIIIDNVDQYSPGDTDAYDIREFIPAADHGSILLTTRLQRLTDIGTSFQISRLTPKDAIQLLLQSSGLSRVIDTNKIEKNSGTYTFHTHVLSMILKLVDIITLAHRLDGLPLAIVIAGSFIRETGVSITEYLQYYQQAWSDLQLQSNPGREYQQGNMLQTWMISYHEIQKRDPNAAALLLLLARFDNRDIWYELVQSGC
jgi:hypothetical protein